MKKILIMLIVTAAVSSAFASKLKWGNTVAITGWDKSATMYLVYGSALPSTSGWDTKTSFTTSDILGGNVVAKDSNGNTLSAALNSANSYIYNDQTGTALIYPVDLDGAGAANGARKFYLAIIADDGSQVALGTIKQQNVTAADSLAINLLWTSASNFTTYKASSVPEPTSGLLLLLGGAMLALRRRRA